MLKMKNIILSICGTNCYILYNDETMEGIIIDPAAEPETIAMHVTRLGVDIKCILLTHGHFDHIGAADALKKKYDICVYAHKDEADITENVMLNLSSMFGEADSVKVDVALEHGQRLEMCGWTIDVIHTPGHTKGSCCYLIDDGTRVRLFSGDTLFYSSHGRTDFPTGSQRQIIDSIVDRLLVLDGDIEVFSGHGEPTTIADEKKWYGR